MTHEVSNALSNLDSHTIGHQQRVADLAVKIAAQINLSQKTIQMIYLAALNHDIGCAFLPQAILQKKENLSQEEFHVIKTHCQLGYNTLMNLGFNPRIALTVYQHHERMDGSGYPAALTKNQILLEAKVLSLADTIDIMSSQYHYRISLAPEEVLEALSWSSGILYDQQVFNACAAIFRGKSQFDREMEGILSHLLPPVSPSPRGAQAFPL